MTARAPLILAALALTGCALPVQATNGPVGAGLPLVSYRVVSESAIERECGVVSVNLAGCAVVRWVILPGRPVPVGLARVAVTSQEPALVAHELCHVVAAFNLRSGAIDRDPCHDDDLGMPVARRRPR